MVEVWSRKTVNYDRILVHICHLFIITQVTPSGVRVHASYVGFIITEPSSQDPIYPFSLLLFTIELTEDFPQKIKNKCS